MVGASEGAAGVEIAVAVAFFLAIAVRLVYFFTVVTGAAGAMGEIVVGMEAGAVNEDDDSATGYNRLVCIVLEVVAPGLKLGAPKITVVVGLSIGVVA